MYINIKDSKNNHYSVLGSRSDSFSLLFSYSSLFNIYFEKKRVNILRAKSKIINAQRILVNMIDSPSKIKLKMIEIITPPNWPPKRRIPEDVPSPTGKVVWLAKSVNVVKKG